MKAHTPWCIRWMFKDDPRWWHSATCEAREDVLYYSIEHATRAHERMGLEVDEDTADRIRAYGAAMLQLTRWPSGTSKDTP